MRRAVVFLSSTVAQLLAIAVLPLAMTSSHSSMISEDLFESNFKFIVYLEFPNGSRHGDVGFPGSHRFHQGTGALYSSESRHFIVTCAHLFTASPFAVIKDVESGRFVQNRSLFPETLTLRVAGGDLLSYGSKMAIQNFILMDELDETDDRPQVRINILPDFVPESDPLRLLQKPKDHWSNDLAVLELGGSFTSLIKRVQPLPVTELFQPELVKTGDAVDLYGFTVPRLAEGPIDFEVDSIITGGRYQVADEETDCKGHYNAQRHLICLLANDKRKIQTRFGNQGAVAIAQNDKGERYSIGLLTAAMNTDGEQYNYLASFSAHSQWIRTIVTGGTIEKSPQKAIDFL